MVAQPCRTDGSISPRLFKNTYIDFMDYLDDESVAWMDENYDATPQTIMLESIRDDIFCQTN